MKRLVRKQERGNGKQLNGEPGAALQETGNRKKEIGNGKQRGVFDD